METISKNQIETKLKHYQQEYQKAIAEYNKLAVIVRQLEGAILACEEMLKEINKDDGKDNNL